MNRLVCIATLALIAHSVTTKLAQADLILNGSFENTTGGLPDNWVSTGNLQVISAQGETHGANALAFSFANLASDGVTSQTFGTIAGASYSLEFDFGKYSINQPLEIARLQVDVFDGTGVGGLQILNQLVIDGTPGTGDPDSTDSASVYAPFQFGFIASGTMSTLRFADLSDPQSVGGGFDAMLDNVRVSAVPEPSAFAFLGLSTFAMFVRLKRRLFVCQD